MSAWLAACGNKASVPEEEKRMIVSIIILIIGFGLLVKGADFFVDGASDIARKLGIPSIVIGLTIVALGTSLRNWR